METLEIHSKAFLLKWVNASPGQTIHWQLKPSKKSINFGLYTHSEDDATPPVQPVPDAEKSMPSSYLSDNLAKAGLQLVIWNGKCLSNELVKGSYKVPFSSNKEKKTFALVFDNTFSRNTAKTVLFSQHVENEILDNASGRNTAANDDAESVATKRSRRQTMTSSIVPETPIPLDNPQLSSEQFISAKGGRLVSAFLLKKRRKKHQGYVRRYFTLDYRHCVLNYYLNEKTSQLRGSMHLKLAAISAKKNSKEIIVDSGMEIWNLKAISDDEWNMWVKALELARLGASAFPDNNTPSVNLTDLLEQLQLANKSNGHKKSGEPTILVNGQDIIDPGIKKLEALYNNLEYAKNLSLLLSSELDSGRKTHQSEEGDEQQHHDETQQDDDEQAQDGAPKLTHKNSFWKRKSRRASSVSSQPPGTPTSPTSTIPDTSNSAIRSAYFDPTVPPVPSIPKEYAHLISPNSENFSKEQTDSSLSPKSVRSEQPQSKPRSKTLSSKPVNIQNDGKSTLQNISIDTLERSGVLCNLLITLSNQLKDIIDEKKDKDQTASRIINKLSRRTSTRDSFMNEEFFDAEEIFEDASDGNGVFLIPDEADDARSNNESVYMTGDSDGDDDAESRIEIPQAAAYSSGEQKLDLSPLPISKAIHRRKDINPSTSTPPSLLSFLRKNVGKDLSSIAMPVTANEPLTLLQRFTEQMEFVNLIDDAVSCNDATTGEKILRVASFAVTCLANNRSNQRAARKPFNPLLGETFELVREDLGFRLIAEKVCHKPVIVAFHAESEKWTFSMTIEPGQKYWGKSVEIITKGLSVLTLRESGDVYQWEQPATFLRNIIAGEKYLEPVNTMQIKSSSGEKAIIEFQAGGMFSGRSEALDITARNDRDKKFPYSVSGKWTTELILHGAKKSEKQIWKPGPLIDKSEKKYGFGVFGASLNQITEIEKGKMAPTDSRNRPDQIAYENGDVDRAENLKLDLEEKQRVRRRENEEAGTQHVPKFFEKEAGSDKWVLIEGEKSYWNRRKRSDWGDLLNLW